MKKILDLMPKEDIDQVDTSLEIKYVTRKCLMCRNKINILKKFKKRVITCPHCKVEMETKL